MITENANIQYLHDLLRGEALRQFDNCFAQVVRTTTAHLNQLILGLVTYFPL